MQTLPIRSTSSISTCTTLNLRRASRAASQFLERYLEPVGLHASQFGILRHVSNAGSIAMTQLADSMSLDRTTLTRNLQILTRDGLVSVDCGSDKRVREIVLTDKGRSVLAQAIPLWEAAEVELEKRLGPGKREALLSYIEALVGLEEE